MHLEQKEKSKGGMVKHVGLFVLFSKTGLHKIRFHRYSDPSGADNTELGQRIYMFYV